MKYSVKTTKRFDKKLKKLDRPAQILILTYIFKNLEGSSNPYQKGKALTGTLQGIWRYRVADYRLLVEIKDEELIIFALDIAHRREIYSSFC